MSCLFVSDLKPASLQGDKPYMHIFYKAHLPQIAFLVDIASTDTLPPSAQHSDAKLTLDCCNEWQTRPSPQLKVWWGLSRPVQPSNASLDFLLDFTCVVVILSMDQQQRLLDLVGLQVGRHVDVGLCCLPQGPLLRLEAKRCQCPVSSHTHCWCWLIMISSPLE